jgi:hypothetical protein
MENEMEDDAVDLPVQIAISATRQMAFELWTEELLHLLIDSGATTPQRVAIMLDRLQQRMKNYPDKEDGYYIHASELKDRIARVSALAETYRAFSPCLAQ